MRGILILLAVAMAWAWLANSDAPRASGEGAGSPDVSVGPPAPGPGLLARLPGWSWLGTEPPPAPPPDPLVPCRLRGGEETYLRRSHCDRRGEVLAEPSWAKLDSAAAATR
jgi:hypothetical protein